MKKLILFVSLAVMGLLTSCIDKHEEVDADSLPSWLHGSIYEELEDPTQGELTGTFTYYLRLVDDLDYAETLSRTGSKTVFPANDEAFEAFFADNDWGVSSYEDFTDCQKKVLLYSSMLDNAILLDMLSNVSNGTSEVSKGQAVKHVTALSVTDSIEYIVGQENMPANNKYWTKYYDNGLYAVRDGTQPMMVHFTRSQMLNNNITTTGEESDFEVLTGSAYEEGDTYIFDDKVIAGDVTCQNGYIHQVENLLVPPGNIAQVLQKSSETTLFSRIVDYFAAPYYNSTITNTYNSWALTNGYNTIDSIFEIRYLSSRSQAATLVTDPNNNTISTTQVLSYDPGWNQYYPAKANATDLDITIIDIAAMFVPNDDAMKEYFLAGGNGAFLIDIYGDRDNTEENLEENLDSLHSKNPQVLTTFIKNLQKSSFVSTVPSKFTTIVNDATENMGMNMSLLDVNDDGSYNVKIANNGVIYVLNEMIAPDEYQAVLAPSSSYPDMQVMNWAVQDRTYLGVDFKYYLLAMSANYAFFIPDDDAFDLYYVDPVCYAKTQPEALHFYYDSSDSKAGGMRCDRYYYDKDTQEIGERIGEADDDDRWSSQMIDILNYHTLVLDDGEVIGNNKYYKTKHGGELYVEGGEVGDHILTGAHIDNNFPQPEIEVVYNEKNGNAYRMSRVIAPTMNSVSTILQSDDRWSEFYEICAGSGATDLLAWAGISSEVNDFGTTDQDRYFVFTSTYGSSSSGTQNACMDENVKMFNTYNYTLYAPNNDAMEEAYAAGLPRWSEIQEMYEQYDHEDSEDISDEEQADMDKAYTMINIIREFVRYHFQTEAMYADNTVESGNYKSMHTDDVGVAQELTVSGGSGYLYVTDGAGVTHTVDASNSSTLVNKMARDYWFDASRQSATSIETSSFCAIHEITEAFMTEEQGEYGGYDEELQSAKAIKKAKQKYIRMSAYN